MEIPHEEWIAILEKENKALGREVAFLRKVLTSVFRTMEPVMDGMDNALCRRNFAPPEDQEEEEE